MRATALTPFPVLTLNSAFPGIVLSSGANKPGPYTPFLYETRIFNRTHRRCGPVEAAGGCIYARADEFPVGEDVRLSTTSPYRHAKIKACYDENWVDTLIPAALDYDLWAPFREPCWAMGPTYTFTKSKVAAPRQTVGRAHGPTSRRQLAEPPRVNASLSKSNRSFQVPACNVSDDTPDHGTFIRH